MGKVLELMNSYKINKHGFMDLLLCNVAFVVHLCTYCTVYNSHLMLCGMHRSVSTVTMESIKISINIENGMAIKHATHPYAIQMFTICLPENCH